MQTGTDPADIAANVRAEAARIGMNQASIARLINKSRASTSERLSGKTRFQVDELQTLATHFGVPLDRLLAPVQAAEVPA